MNLLRNRLHVGPAGKTRQCRIEHAFLDRFGQDRIVFDDHRQSADRMGERQRKRFRLHRNGKRIPREIDERERRVPPGRPQLEHCCKPLDEPGDRIVHERVSLRRQGRDDGIDIRIGRVVFLHAIIPDPERGVPLVRSGVVEFFGQPSHPVDRSGGMDHHLADVVPRREPVKHHGVVNHDLDGVFDPRPFVLVGEPLRPLDRRRDVRDLLPAPPASRIARNEGVDRPLVAHIPDERHVVGPLPSHRVELILIHDSGRQERPIDHPVVRVPDLVGDRRDRWRRFIDDAPRLRLRKRPGDHLVVEVIEGPLCDQIAGQRLVIVVPHPADRLEHRVDVLIRPLHISRERPELRVQVQLVRQRAAVRFPDLVRNQPHRQEVVEELLVSVIKRRLERRLDATTDALSARISIAGRENGRIETLLRRRRKVIPDRVENFLHQLREFRNRAPPLLENLEKRRSLHLRVRVVERIRLDELRDSLVDSVGLAHTGRRRRRPHRFEFVHGGLVQILVEPHFPGEIVPQFVERDLEVVLPFRPDDLIPWLVDAERPPFRDPPEPPPREPPHERADPLQLHWLRIGPLLRQRHSAAAVGVFILLAWDVDSVVPAPQRFRLFQNFVNRRFVRIMIRLHENDRSSVALADGLMVCPAALACLNPGRTVSFAVDRRIEWVKLDLRALGNLPSVVPGDESVKLPAASDVGFPLGQRHENRIPVDDALGLVPLLDGRGEFCDFVAPFLDLLEPTELIPSPARFVLQSVPHGIRQKRIHHRRRSVEIDALRAVQDPPDISRCVARLVQHGFQIVGSV